MPTHRHTVDVELPLAVRQLVQGLLVELNSLREQLGLPAVTMADVRRHGQAQAQEDCS